MIHSSLKRAVAVAMLGGISFGANATTTDLGTVSTSAPTGLAGTVLGDGMSFSDIFTFTLSQPNVSSSYEVANVPTTVGSTSFDGILSAMSLFSAGANGAIGGGDDTLLASATNSGGDSLSLDYNQSLSGLSYISVTGISNASGGAIYAGEITAAIPEPETYAMLMAGLGLMGAVVRRRSKNKAS